ncbi:MAG: protease complex subunit PrcB family protein [Candidatus Didemnitutus sp.]|nr:protease complex subunit PrcB family protein [Candidatus Didemnitutus sp.]
MKIHFCSVLGSLLLLVAPALATEPTGAPILQQQWSANSYADSGTEPSAWRIMGLGGWQEFWAHQLSQEPPPAPDFERCSVVVLAAGRRSTGGYRAEVVRAVRESNQWVIEFIVHRPSPASFVTQALTYPVAVAVFSGSGIFRPQVRNVSPPDEAHGESTER